MLEIDNDAPNFALQNQDFVEISLADFRGKWVVLYFYPKDNTSGCTKEACDFSASRAEFEKIGAITIGISPDSVKSHQNFIAKQNLTHTLLSDPDHIALGVYGVWQEKSMYGRKYMGAARTTFLINPQGRIAFIWRKVSVSGHAAAVLSKLKEIAG